MQDKLFISAEIAQDWVDIAVADEPALACRIADTAEAIAAWLTTLPARRLALVAFEPAGGLERRFRAALIAAKLPCLHSNTGDGRSCSRLRRPRRR